MDAAHAECDALRTKVDEAAHVLEAQRLRGAEPSAVEPVRVWCAVPARGMSARLMMLWKQVQAETAAKAEAAAMQLRQAEHEIGELQQQARPRIQQNATYNTQRSHTTCNMQAGRGRRSFQSTENERGRIKCLLVPKHHSLRARNCPDQPLDHIGMDNSMAGSPVVS